MEESGEAGFVGELCDHQASGVRALVCALEVTVDRVSSIS